MKYPMKLLLMLSCLMIIVRGYNQVTEDILIRTLKENTYSLAIENGKLTGDGADAIRKTLNSAQFLLVGEQHGIKEVAEFTEALFSESNPFGFNYLCIETDPYVACKLEYLANEGEEAFAKFISEFLYPGRFLLTGIDRIEISIATNESFQRKPCEIASK